MTSSPYQPVLETTRGTTVESVHFGALAVVDAHGRLIASYGDPDSVTFLRSSAKPFQALPFIEAGGHIHYSLTKKEIALLCASHSGTDEHAETVTQIQHKANLHESDLMCGVHPPMHKDTADRMLIASEPLTQNRHNCSGKHSGMLAFAQMNGEPLETYLENDHPVQQRILTTFAEMCGISEDEVHLGTDGCSAPNFAVSLAHSAFAWARLADPSGLGAARQEACRLLTDAMMAHPNMVAGPDRFDTALMQAAEGKLVAKAGAEGYQGIAVMPGSSSLGLPAMGIALKISDGDGKDRARAVVVMEVLRQLGVLSSDQLEALSSFGPVRSVLNWRKLVVGEMYPVFNLEIKTPVTG